MTQTENENTLEIPVRVGTMGWSYSDWYGVFYPQAVASRDAIALYTRAFDCVEIDSTFYGTPRETHVRHWKTSTPDNFRFCPKVPREITHDKGLIDVQEDLRNFVRVMGGLGEKRGPMLLQFPPSFTRAELPNLQAFLPLLFELHDEAARFAIEFRHRSLIGPDVSALLAEHGVALAAADYPGMPRRFEATSDFAYLRLIGRHGAFPQHREIQADKTPEVEKWAEVLRTHQDKIRSAFVLCNNDYEGYAPETANKFKRLLGQDPTQRPPETQGSLF